MWTLLRATSFDIGSASRRATVVCVQHQTGTLSEREKEALRLLANGHDAKSAAGVLQVSVNAINERLREARRKLGTTSSREAARILADFEGGCSQKSWDKKVRLDTTPIHAINGTYPAEGRVKRLLFLCSLGVGIMIVVVLIGTVFANPADNPVRPVDSSSVSIAGSASSRLDAPATRLRPWYLVDVDGTVRGQSVASSQMPMQAGSMASLSDGGAYELHFNVAPDPEDDGKLLVSVNVVLPGTDATLRYSRTLSVAPGQPAKFALEAIGGSPSPGSLTITPYMASLHS